MEAGSSPRALHPTTRLVRRTLGASVLGTALSVMGCVDRNVSAEAFACGGGGPCDAGAESADAADDGGVPRTTDASAPTHACSGSPRIPSSGIIEGDTSLGMDRLESVCSEAAGAPEALHRLEIPVPLAELELDTSGSSFDTVLSLFGPSCEETLSLACNDDASSAVSTSRITLEEVPRGTYHVAVEGRGGVAGPFRMRVRGVTPRLGDCSAVPFLECPRATRAELLASGEGHTCSQRGGLIRCFGSNESGQLGGELTDVTPIPMLVARVQDAARIAAGGHHTCAVRAEGGLACWGRNDLGQLGDRSTISSAVPRPVTGLGVVRDVTAGLAHTCALLSSGTAACWGDNASGQLGDRSRSGTSAPRPVVDLEGAVALEAGFRHTCAVLRDGTVRCWGDNSAGQLGDGTRDSRTAPVSVPGLVDVVELAAGAEHTCALNVDGAVHCWGDNTSGQLGDGTLDPRTAPTRVPGLPRAVEIAAGARHTCAILGSGALSCWGDNTSGQLGDGTQTPRVDPGSVGGLSDVGHIAAGAAHTCAARGSGEILCWGRNAAGQLGNGSTEDATVPSPVPAQNPVPVTLAGQISHFLILGPFVNDVCGVVESAAIDEGAVMPILGSTAADRTWARASSTCFSTYACEGTFGFDFQCHFSGGELQYAYAAIYVVSPDERDVVITYGNDDGLALWVNGEEQLLNQRGYCGGCREDSFESYLRLRAGTNLFLMKVGQAGGAWGVTLKFYSATTYEPMTDLILSETP